MGLQSTITHRFDNGYVLVEIGSRNKEPHYYTLPENKADEFQREYKKNSNKLGWASAGVMLAAIAAVLTPVALTTKNIQNKFARNALGVAAGIAGGIGSMFINYKLETNSHQKLLKKYDAKIVDSSKPSVTVDTIIK